MIFARVKCIVAGLRCGMGCRELLVLECGVELMDEWIDVTSGNCTGDVVVVKGQSREQREKCTTNMCWLYGSCGGELPMMTAKN
jgi:hypothetical protein